MTNPIELAITLSISIYVELLKSPHLTNEQAREIYLAITEDLHEKGVI